MNGIIVGMTLESSALNRSQRNRLLLGTQPTIARLLLPIIDNTKE